MDFKSFRNEILSGKESVKDLIGDFFKKIDNSNPNLNAYISTTKEKLFCPPTGFLECSMLSLA